MPVEQPSASFNYGFLWNQSAGFLTGRDESTPAPWSAELAEERFGRSGALQQLTVLKGAVEAPEALAVFQNAGHTVQVQFLNEEFFPEVEYRFTDHAQETVLSEDGVQRPGHLFLTHVHKFSYTGERDRYNDAVKLEFLGRMHSNLGTTFARARIQAPGGSYPTQDWHVDPDVDVAGDGFWEPVATFGDWDRWFVRDRPGVKLFD